MKRIKRRLILRMTETSVYKWLLLKVIPYVRFSFYYTSIRGWQYFQGYNRLKPGHILLTTDKWKLTSLLIPGEWSHAALCVGKDRPVEIHEMTHHNFTMSTFFDILKESTRVVILRCTDWDDAYVMQVIEKSWSFIDTPYDTSFLPGPRLLGCSEHIYEADFGRRLQVDTSDLLGLGMPYVTPDDIYRARNVEVVWDSDRNEHGDPNFCKVRI